jgi:hypothetical protein
MENSVKIVRLQNGEDIVGYVSSKEKGIYDITEPMSVGVHFSNSNNEAGLIMRHWLPIQIIKKNEIVLTEKDILCMFEPADDFCEYYTNTVQKVRELLKAKNLVDSLEENEINDIMEAFDEFNNDGKTLH